MALSQNQKTGIITLLEKKIDVVMLYSVPTNGLQTIYSARRLNIPVVFRSIDLLHQLVPPVLSMPTKFLERRVYARADEILTITPNHSRYILSMGAAESKIKMLLESDLCFARIRKIQMREYDGFVYDVSVPPKESFLGGTGLLFFHNTLFIDFNIYLGVPDYLREVPAIGPGGKYQWKHADGKIEELDEVERGKDNKLIQPSEGRILTYKDFERGHLSQQEALTLARRLYAKEKGLNDSIVNKNWGMGS